MEFSSHGYCPASHGRFSSAMASGANALMAPPADCLVKIVLGEWRTSCECLPCAGAAPDMDTGNTLSRSRDPRGTGRPLTSAIQILVGGRDSGGHPHFWAPSCANCLRSRPDCTRAQQLDLGVRAAVRPRTSSRRNSAAPSASEKLCRHDAREHRVKAPFFMAEQDAISTRFRE